MEKLLMAEDPAQYDPQTPAEIDESTRLPAWSQIWQIPVLLAGLVLFVLGLILAMPTFKEADFPGTLDSAKAKIESLEFEEAGRELDKVGDHLAEASPADEVRYWLLLGDLVYLRQREQKGDLKENHVLILEYYGKARKLKQKLDPDRLERFILTLVSLNRMDTALEKMERLEDQPARRRYTIIRHIIERRRDRDAGIVELTPLLERFLDEVRKEIDSDSQVRERLWAATVRAGLLRKAGNPQEAIKFLTRRLSLFEANGHGRYLAPLYLHLAKAYQQTGEQDEARRHYLIAQSRISSTDPMNADVLVGMGQLELSQYDRVEEALGFFTKAAIRFPGHPPYVAALLGRGDCEAKLGWHAVAIDHFKEAAAHLLDKADTDDPRREELAGIVRSHHALNFDKGHYERAIDYITILEGFDEQMPQLLLELAMTHKHLAQQVLDRASKGEGPGEGAGGPGGAQGGDGAARVEMPSAGVREEQFQTAALKFRKAGEYFYEHARALTRADDASHGRSLWEAAEAFDKARLWQKAIEVYSLFVRTRASDQYFLRATHRLALAYQAEGQHEAAIENFLDLIDKHGKSQVSFESLVPLARSYIALGRSEDAEARLRQVVDGHPTISPDSREYREALIELGKLHHRQGELNQALARFSVAVDRYGDSREGPFLQFYLADSYRQSVDALDEKLESHLSQSVEQQFRQERADRLLTAQHLYREVIEALENRPEDAKGNPSQQLFLRNAYFYRADCAYMLKKWNEARSYYDEAAKRWDRHPASMVARIQIVNTYAVQGMVREARVANDQAREQLKRIPEEAFDDPSLPLTHRHWQEWLYWTSTLELNGQQANAGAAP